MTDFVVFVHECMSARVHRHTREFIASENIAVKYQNGHYSY